MKGLVVTIALVIGIACKDKPAWVRTLPTQVAAHDHRYYALQLTAYRDQHRLKKERVLVNNRHQDVELRVAVKFSPGKDDINSRRDNPYILVRNMDDPTDCYQVASLYDYDSDPPIYEKGRANANYHKRLDFHAFSAGQGKGAGKLFSFRWFYGKKYPDYGIMRKFQIKHARVAKPSIFFLQEAVIKLTPAEIEQQFFNPDADNTCQRAFAQKNIKRPPISGTFYYYLTLPKYKSAGKDKEQLDEKLKIALRLDFSPTEGGSQYVEVIVKNRDKPKQCYAFVKHAQTHDQQAYNDKYYDKHIEIAKKFGDSDRYYAITWLRDTARNAQVGYFYLDERTGGDYYEYTGTTAPSVPTQAEIEQLFPAADPAAGCELPDRD